MARRDATTTPRRPTLGDVAELAGVSPMTASRALNNERYVSEGAASKVREAALQLGFVPHHGARSLATNRADTIGLVVPMAGEQFFADPNIAPILAGASAELAELGSQLIVLIAGNDYQADKVRQFVLARHVDGVVIISPEIIPDVVTDLIRAGVPLAATGTILERPGLDVVDVDTASALRRATDHLLTRGAQRTVLIAGASGEPSTNLQIAAYTEATNGGRTAVEHGDYSEASGRSAMHRVLERIPEVDGVLVVSDVMARGAVQAILDSGRRVPDDIRVIGYDDSSVALGGSPTLTTVRVPFARIGGTMARLVLERADDPSLPPRRLTLDTELVVREST